MNNARPAVFLDVDGVINDLKYWDVNNLPEGYTYDRTGAGYTVVIPDEVKELVARIHEVADIYWLTTWRERANAYISPLLGLPSDLPVITDGTDDRYVGWKSSAARPIAEALMAEGRKVYWIEDFYGQLPFMPGVTLVDTGAEEVLTAGRMPLGLI